MLGQISEYFAIEVEPKIEIRLRCPGLIASTGHSGFANAAIDAFVRMDDEHVLLVEAVHGAELRRESVYCVST